MKNVAKWGIFGVGAVAVAGIAVLMIMSKPKTYPAICWKNLRGTEISDDYCEKIVLEEKSNREFVWKKNSVTANVGGEETFLTGGMPVWAVYFSDLTGDGEREMIAEISTGGATSHDVIVVYDLKKQTTYTLDEPQMYNYTTYFENGEVCAIKKPYGSPNGSGISGVLKVTDSGLALE